MSSITRGDRCGTVPRLLAFRRKPLAEVVALTERLLAEPQSSSV